MDDDRAAVRATYERIADHFAATREYPWPEVESFCAGRHADRAVDIGCGNGRHTALLADHAETVVGVDVSRRLLGLARERAPEGSFLAGDASALPLTDDCAELAVYVATLHHLPTRELRRQSLDEVARILIQDGEALVSAWSTAHDAFDASADATEGFDTDVDWTLPGGETVPRFYHIYAPTEFDADIAASDLEVVDSRISSGNCYAVVTPA
ncbi:class I SAM-dependent methyltransferase [Natronomonas gomsonensis]|uniref:class I SAM-dependent methyltransferase n=1 Tax=Natronomonas gomsonensis TaxID=1046043 RepID=UPI0015C1A341|nr:class I SAM-dependent methyltransferase [Natronomonas gomsonensis]